MALSGNETECNRRAHDPINMHLKTPIVCGSYPKIVCFVMEIYVGLSY